MFLVTARDYSEQDLLLRHPETVREELSLLETALKEGEDKLSRFEDAKNMVEAISASTKQEILDELLSRVEEAETEYLNICSEYEARKEELAEILFHRRKRGMLS